MYFLRIVMLTVLLLLPGLASAQHVKFEFKSDNNELLIIGKAQPGWKVYANEAGDIGMPFLITLSNKNNVDKERVMWPKHEVLKEEIGPDVFKINYYHDTFKIKLKLLPINPQEPMVFDLNAQYGLCNNVCLHEEKLFHIKVEKGVVYVSEHKDGKLPEEALGFWQILLFAAVGGFILNFMPCVLPVLGIKILTLVKSHETKGLSLATAMGIICSFIVLGVITVSLKFMGEVVGWGLQFQNEYFILALIMLLIAMASNYYGDYEISLPRKFADAAHINVKNQYLNSFLSGVVAVILATPCTAPFLSASLAVALTGPYIGVMATFLAIGVGMAVPFLLVVVAPKLLKLLPKPGRWMVGLKKVFAFFFIATAIWLLSILYFNVGVYWVVIFALSFWALRMVLKSKVRKKFRIVIAFICIWFLALYFGDRTSEKSHEVGSWEEFSTERLEQAIDTGRPVLVNVTAKWCLTCKLNELRVLDDSEVLTHLHALNVVFLRADYTFKNPVIQEFIKQHNRAGIPLTVVYGGKSKKGIVLSEVLDKASLLAVVKKAR